MLWMLVVPTTIGYLLTTFVLDSDSYLYFLLTRQTPIDSSMLFILGILLNVIIMIIGIWGSACILIVGKRLIKSPAGRTRSSFKLVRKQGAKLIVPLFLTTILRLCITSLWALLLIVPGIIYYIRSTFFGIIIACEGKEYRNSLQRSKKIVKGHTLVTLLYLVSISLAIIVPTILITSSLTGLTLLDERLIYAASIISIAVSAFAQLIMILTTILLFKHVKALS